MRIHVCMYACKVQFREGPRLRIHVCMYACKVQFREGPRLWRQQATMLRASFKKLYRKVSLWYNTAVHCWLCGGCSRNLLFRLLKASKTILDHSSMFMYTSLQLYAQYMEAVCGGGGGNWVTKGGGRTNAPHFVPPPKILTSQTVV